MEAVVQIVKTRPNSHVLISAQSNSACDEIGVRLLRSMPKSKIFRFYSPSIGSKFNDETLKSTSNMRSGKNEYPTYEEFYHFNVVICTLVTAGRLVQMNFKVDHFHYVFIDECAASTEPEAFIPIFGQFYKIV